MNFTPEQARKYYETRMGGEIRRSGASYMGRCPFHDDTTPSMSFNFEKGVWHCHTEHIGGGMVDFEMRLNGVSASTAAEVPSLRCACVSASSAGTTSDRGSLRYPS